MWSSFYCAKVVMTRAVPTVLRISVLRTRHCFASAFLYPILKDVLRAMKVKRGCVADTDDDDGEEAREVRAKKEQREEIEKWARYCRDWPSISLRLHTFHRPVCFGSSWLEKMCCARPLARDAIHERSVFHHRYGVRADV